MKEDLFYINIFKEAYLAVNVAINLEDIDNDKTFLAGSSQGAGISIVTAALQENIKKVYLLYPFLTDFRIISKHKTNGRLLHRRRSNLC